MSLDADYLLDRRALKRRVTLWRLLAIVMAIGLTTFLFLGHPAPQFKTVHVALLQIKGTIYHDKREF